MELPLAWNTMVDILMKAGKLLEAESMVRSYCCQYLFADFRSYAWSDMRVLVARPMLKILKFAWHVCCLFILPFVPSISDATCRLYSALMDKNDQKEVPYMWVVLCTLWEKSIGRLLNYYTESIARSVAYLVYAVTVLAIMWLKKINIMNSGIGNLDLPEELETIVSHFGIN